MNEQDVLINQEGHFKCALCGKDIDWMLKVKKVPCPDASFYPTSIETKPNRYVSFLLQVDGTVNAIVPCDQCGYATQIPNLKLLK